MHSPDVAKGLDLPRIAVAPVLAGVRGSRLMNLTDTRARPVLYFGGKFRSARHADPAALNKADPS